MLQVIVVIFAVVSTIVVGAFWLLWEALVLAVWLVPVLESGPSGVRSGRPPRSTTPDSGSATGSPAGWIGDDLQ